MLNEKRSIIRSSSGKPHWLPSYILEAHLASYFASITVFELLMFFTFKHLNFLKSLNFLKFLTLSVQLKRACC